MASLVVTDQNCKLWEKSGKSEFLKFCKLQIVHSPLGNDVVEKDLKRALYELCWHLLRGDLKQESVVSVLQDVTALHEAIPSLLADVLSIIDLESTLQEEKSQRENLLTLLPLLTSLVPDGIFKERLDLETLEGAGLLDSRVRFQSKYVKIKTKQYYKQQKFNLLREESEGYSKLIAELNQDVGTDATLDQVLEAIRALVGCFNLDPNRVLDILLESFECRPERHAFFIPLLRAYMNDADTLCHVLGFKFHFYPQQDGGETPPSLYKVAALMMYHGLIDLCAIYPHLKPPDNDIIADHQREIQEAKAYQRKLTVVSLSADSVDGKTTKEDKEKEKDVVVENQKLGLLEALLSLGDWEHAKSMMDRFPPYWASRQPRITSALCALCHHIIENIYAKHSGLQSVLLKKRKCMTSPDVVGVPQVTTYEDLNQVLVPILKYLGPQMHCDPPLMGKIIRLAKSFMPMYSNTPKPELELVFFGFLTVMDEVILPSLSLLPANCCMSEEIWSFLKLLKYEHRYRLYGQWKNDTFKQHPKLIRAYTECVDRAKYIMKRLAKENVKPLGRQIGKLSHSNPGVLFEYILSAIQKFDNFIGPVVDSLKYLTPLSYDILSYCIIEALANPARERLKHDDTNISMWLQSLASFCGAIFKKYQMEIAGLLQYVVNQLKASKSYDLLILREVLQKMAGVEASEETTDDQLEAAGGGELLRQEGGYFVQVRNTKKSSTRLKETLMEHDLAIPFCILMAQQRNQILYRIEGVDNRHIKLIGKLYDQCQDTFVQFIAFLSLQLTVDDMVKRLPPIDVLLSQYHVSPDTAFSLARTIYANSINTKYEELRKIDKKDKVVTTVATKTQRYLEAVEHVMLPVTDLIRTVCPVRSWDDFSPIFYTSFWTLSMYDLHVPVGAYEKQVSHIESQIKDLEDSRDMAQSKKKKEKERCIALKDKLHDEKNKQQDHNKLVLARLESEKGSWFQTRSTKNMAVTAFLQHCIFPRCCFTAIDAVYCAKFIHILHQLKTPNFSSLICYDRIFNDVTFSVTSCTESEAHRYGRFLLATLETIMRWHGDPEIYNNECSSFPGFVTVFRGKGAQGNNKADQLDYENYRHVCHKWHFSLTKSMVACLESGNYIQIRNALIVLTKVLPQYPRLTKFGQALERRVEKVCEVEKEERPDLFAIATGYAGQLNMKRGTWELESDFHLKDKDAREASKHAQANSEDAASKEAPVKKEAADPKENGKGPDGKEAKPSKSDISMKAERESKSSRSSKSSAANGSVTDKKESSGKEKDKERKSKERAEKAERKKEQKERKEAKAAAKEEKAQAKGKEEKSDSPKVDKNKSAEKESKREDKEDKREREKTHEEEQRHAMERERERHNEERERFASQRAREMERDRYEDDWHRRRDGDKGSRSISHDRDQDRPSSSGSLHGHRRSLDSSPLPHEDRDLKRRKMEMPSPKDAQMGYSSEGRDRSHKSPAHDRSEREREKDRSRKRDRSNDQEAIELKRHKVEEGPSTSARRYANGEPSEERRERDSSKTPKDRSRDSRDREAAAEHMAKKTSKKDSPDKEKRSKKSKK